LFKPSLLKGESGIAILTIRSRHQSVQKVNESRHDRFERLSQRRLEKTIKQIESIGRLSNRNNYAYSKDELKAMFEKLCDAIIEAKGRFDNTYPYFSEDFIDLGFYMTQHMNRRNGRKGRMT